MSGDGKRTFKEVVRLYRELVDELASAVMELLDFWVWIAWLKVERYDKRHNVQMLTEVYNLFKIEIHQGEYEMMSYEEAHKKLVEDPRSERILTVLRKIAVVHGKAVCRTWLADWAEKMVAKGYREAAINDFVTLIKIELGL